MYYIDTSDAVTAAAKPTPPTAGSEKFFSDTPGSATVVPAWFLNMLQEELGNVVSAASLSHSKTDNSQLLKAVQALITSKTTGTLLASKNLSDVADVATARSNLGLAMVASSGSYTDLGNKPDLTALSGYAKTTTGAKLEAFNAYGGDLNIWGGSPGVVITECLSTCTNMPSGLSTGVLIQFADGGGDDVRLQFMVDPTGLSMYQRIKWGGGASGNWSAWRKISQTPYDIPFLAGWGSDMSGEDLTIRQYGGIVIPRDVTFAPATIVTYCEVPPTGSAVVFDVRVNGSSIFNILPTIPVGSPSNTAGTGTSSTITLSRFDRLTFHVTQVGSTVKGQKLYACIKGLC